MLATANNTSVGGDLYVLASSGGIYVHVVDNSVVDEKGWTNLHWAVFDEATKEELETLCNKYPDDLEKFDSNSYTPLYLAIALQNLTAFNYLLDKSDRGRIFIAKKDKTVRSIGSSAPKKIGIVTLILKNFDFSEIKTALIDLFNISPTPKMTSDVLHVYLNRLYKEAVNYNIDDINGENSFFSSKKEEIQSILDLLVNYGADTSSREGAFNQTPAEWISSRNLYKYINIKGCTADRGPRT